MSLLDRILSVTKVVNSYAAIAAVAVARVQSEVGSSNGDPAVKASKLQTAVTYILAAAHAGEEVPAAKVQQIAAAVELQVTLAKILGLGGKSATPSASVTVPAA